MSDPLAPFAGVHEGRIYAVATWPDTTQRAWFAGCSCGFVAEARPTPGAAAADLIGHRPQETP